MGGGPGLRDLLLQDGNRGIANRAYLPDRNVRMAGSGLTSYGEVLTGIPALRAAVHGLFGT
jgi:hypothetical protein